LKIQKTFTAKIEIKPASPISRKIKLPKAKNNKQLCWVAKIFRDRDILLNFQNFIKITPPPKAKKVYLINVKLYLSIPVK
tara:strand:+ start:142 stop:381 length:240 start_codon:yes stop_codon:yes gene_type:complete